MHSSTPLGSAELFVTRYWNPVDIMVQCGLKVAISEHASVPIFIDNSADPRGVLDCIVTRKSNLIE